MKVYYRRKDMDASGVNMLVHYAKTECKYPGAWCWSKEELHEMSKKNLGLRLKIKFVKN